MQMKFECTRCGQTYKRETYTASAAKHVKEYWRGLQGTAHGLCEECYQLDLEEKRKAENEAAALKSEKLELAPLEGSEKQVAWANTIRVGILDKFDEWETDMAKQIKTIEETTGLTDEQKTMSEQNEIWVKNAREYIGSISDARTFIDYRDKSLKFWVQTAEKRNQ